MNQAERVEWERVRAHGRSRFVLTGGVLARGVPFALAMVLFDLLLRLEPSGLAEGLWPLSAEFRFLALSFGLAIGEAWWWLNEKQYWQAVSPERVKALGDGH